MDDTLNGLYEVILQRKAHHKEGSYTSYLFAQGIDKILKKCGEECAEVIIAAKNGDNGDTEDEICDLLYHLLVLMAEQGIPMEEVRAVLEKRREKIGNLKTFHQANRES